MLSTHEKVANYTDRLTAWLKARKEHPGFYHGIEPVPEEYGITTENEKWLANKTRERVMREMERAV